jgi:HEAT repeat protein
VAAASVAHAATERPLALAQQLARSRLVVAGAVTHVEPYDEGRLTVARVRVDRVLKGAASGNVDVVEQHDLPSVPDLLHAGDHVVLFLIPPGHSSSLARALPPDRYLEPSNGRQGVIVGPATAVDQAADIIERIVAASAAPEADLARRAALRRALVFDEIDARNPRLVFDGALGVPGIPDLAGTLTDGERRRLEAALERTDLPVWVRVQLVDAVGAAKLAVLAPGLRTLPQAPAPVLQASWNALRTLGAPPSAADLASALGSTDPDVRAAAARALPATGVNDAIPRVTHLALDDPSSDVRTAAAEALGDTRRPEALPSLEQVFSRGDWPARQAAGRAISHIGGRPAQQTFADLAFDGPLDAQQYAVVLLLMTGIPHDDPLVERIRTSHPDAGIRRLVTEGPPELTN